MTGIIKLYTPGGKPVKSVSFYSKEQAKDFYTLWAETYPDHFIHIVPDAGPCNISLPSPERVKVPLLMRKIEMPDFVQAGPFVHETYYHRCYFKNEKL